MNKKSYFSPTYRIVHLGAICEDDLMKGTGNLYEGSEVGDGGFDATRSYDNQWDFEWE